MKTSRVFPNLAFLHADNIAGSYALQIFYFLSSVFFKTSLILLYWRIFGVSRGFRKVLIVAWSIVIMYFVANLLAAIFECNPIAKYWNMGLSGKCVDTVAFYRWNGVANLLIDFMILTLTLPMVWQLSLKLQQKVVITGLFLLGCLWVLPFPLHACDGNHPTVSSFAVGLPLVEWSSGSPQGCRNSFQASS